MRTKFGLFLAVIMLSACGGYESKYMHPLAAGAPMMKPAAGQALVVFVRPTNFAFKLGTTILDEQGHFVGDSGPKSHFAYPVTPGTHEFIVWGENTDVLQLTAAAGKTYYIEVSPKMGAWSARMHLFAIKPSAPTWPKLGEWLSESAAYEPDPQAGQAKLDTRQKDVAERVRRAQEHLHEYSGEDLDRRTLIAADGT